MMRWKRQSDAGEQENPFNLSISDLMAGVLVIFILTLVTIFIDYKKSTDYIDRAPVQRLELLNDIYNKFVDKLESEDGIKIDRERGVIIIYENSITSANGIFKRGEAQLTLEGQRKIELLVNSIVDIRNQEEQKVANNKFIKDETLKKENNWDVIDTVAIEGHADNTGNTNENLKLSTNRAINTWLYMSNKRSTINNYRNKDGQFLFSVAGYGDKRPLKGVSPDADDQRRIEIRFIMRPAGTDKLRNLNE